MISYSRKIRSLEEIAQFKANEYFNCLFYISPSYLYSHLMDLAVGIRLLLDSWLEAHVSKAEKLLDNFCKEIVTVRGEERIENINVHCVRHLAGQVRRFGTLISQSAMSFEAANRSLGELFSGSHSECEVICRRILQRHRLSNYSSENPTLKTILSKLSQKKRQSGILTFSDNFFETTAVKEARKKYASKKFINRVYCNDCYFDSPAYKRSTLGNCFVRFHMDSQELFGQIQYFLESSDEQHTSIQANIIMFSVKESVGPVQGFYYRVAQTKMKNSYQLKDYKKFFISKLVNQETATLLSLLLFVNTLESFNVCFFNRINVL